MRHLSLLAAAVAIAAPVAAKDHPAAETKQAVAAALADPARADQAADDARRKAAEVIAFSGVGAGDTVVDFFPGSGDGRGPTTMLHFDPAVFKMLKPGGTYLVIDHADAAGSGLAGTQSKHRIDPAAARAQIEKAGFKFVGETKVLHNPVDDHSKIVFDPAIHGHTDQFVYKFRKP